MNTIFTLFQLLLTSSNFQMNEKKEWWSFLIHTNWGTFTCQEEPHNFHSLGDGMELNGKKWSGSQCHFQSLSLSFESYFLSSFIRSLDFEWSNWMRVNDEGDGTRIKRGRISLERIGYQLKRWRITRHVDRDGKRDAEKNIVIFCNWFSDEEKNENENNWTSFSHHSFILILFETFRSSLLIILSFHSPPLFLFFFSPFFFVPFIVNCHSIRSSSLNKPLLLLLLFYCKARNKWKQWFHPFNASRYIYT